MGREFLLCTALANRREMGKVLGHNDRAISQELVCVYIHMYNICCILHAHMHNVCLSVRVCGINDLYLCTRGYWQAA